MKRNQGQNAGNPARHAQTHDVRREEFTNPKGPPPAGETFDEMSPDTSAVEPHGHADESVAATQDKELYGRLNMLDGEEFDRLTVLQRGARLDQGAVYLDLNDLERGPFKAIGGQEAGPDNRYVAKKDTDYELWNRLAGQDREAEIERPSGVS